MVLEAQLEVQRMLHCSTRPLGRQRVTPTARLVAAARRVVEAHGDEASPALHDLVCAIAAMDATPPAAEPTDDCGTALAAKRQPLDHPASDEELYSLHEIAFDDAGPVTEPTGKKQIIAAARALYRLGVERERARQDATKPRPFGEEESGFWSENVGAALDDGPPDPELGPVIHAPDAIMTIAKQRDDYATALQVESAKASGVEDVVLSVARAIGLDHEPPGSVDELLEECRRLRATPAAQSPTPTPTDEELFDIYANERGPTAGRRALYNAGRAACVARLRAAKATAVRYEALKIRDARVGHEPDLMRPIDAECLIEAIARRLEAADALESER